MSKTLRRSRSSPGGQEIEKEGREACVAKAARDMGVARAEASAAAAMREDDDAARAGRHFQYCVETEVAHRGLMLRKDGVPLAHSPNGQVSGAPCGRSGPIGVTARVSSNQT